MITTINDGPLLVESNYWQTDLAARGLYYVTPNAGCVRLLVPASCSHHLAEIRTAREVVITRGIYSGGQFPQMSGRESTEFLFDDHTENPFTLYFSIEQWERLPDPAADDDRIFEFAAYEDRRGAPHMVFSSMCYIRSAPLPCLKSWA